MSRHLSRHSGVSCDSCGKGSFTGKRYKCLTCYDFDLCQDCYDAGETGQGRHSVDHPIQVILYKVDADLYYGGESHSMEHPQSYTCPLCGEMGLSENDLRDHVTRQHAGSSNLQEVICPVCAAHPGGSPNHLTDDFPNHLMLDHSHRDTDQDQGSMHSRVRRMMVRRRGGDRHYGLLRGESQDSNIDPLSELLSQLGAGAGRRIPSDIPPHIQQLLEQDRQSFERASPSRRPVYRKILIGNPSGSRAGGGHAVFTPSLREYVELSKSSATRDTSSSKSDSNILTNQTEKDSSKYLLNSSLDSNLSEEEKKMMQQLRSEKSLFVQDLLLSSLAFSSDSGSDSSEES